MQKCKGFFYWGIFLSSWRDTLKYFAWATTFLVVGIAVKVRAHANEGVATRPTTSFMQHEDEEDEEPKEQKDNDFSGIINKLKNYLVEYYEPVQNAKDADFTYSTDEIYAQLQRIVPNEIMYSRADVALWLHNAGFTFADFGELRFEWLMKKKM